MLLWCERTSTPFVFCLLALAVSVAGCGVDKLGDDTVDVVEVIAANPRTDLEIIGVAAVIAGGVIVHVSDGDAFRQRPRGASYRARLVDDGGAVIERLDAGDDAPRIIVDASGLVAWAVGSEHIYGGSGDGATFSAGLDGSDLRPERSTSPAPR